MSLLRQTLLRRVVLALLIAFSIAWVVLILFQYAEVRFQESANPALHDAAAQVADVLTGVDDPSEARIISAAIDHSIARARQRRQIPGAVLLQVWEREDRSLVFSSPAAAGAVLQGDPARQTRQVLHGDSYEVVKLDTSRWSILLAQSSLDTGWVLGALSADLTKYVLIAFPFVLLPIWLAVSRGLGPLRQLSERIARRSPEDLTPIGIEPRYEELKPLVVSLDTLLAQLRRKIDNEQTFLATVAHELRTPLAVINAQATVLAKAANEQERLEAEQRMNAAIVRHAHLVHQLLVLARMETAQPADVAEVDLAMLAREEIGNLVPAALAREIEIALEAPETLIFPVEVSAFQSALQNLLDIDHTLVVFHSCSVRMLVYRQAASLRSCWSATLWQRKRVWRSSKYLSSSSGWSSRKEGAVSSLHAGRSERGIPIGLAQTVRICGADCCRVGRL